METIFETAARLVMGIFVGSIPALYFAYYLSVVRENKKKRDRWEKNETSKDHKSNTA